MKKFKVFIEGITTPLVYNSIATATKVAVAHRDILGCVVKVVTDTVESVKELFDTDDLDAALTIIFEGCTGKAECIESYNWALSVRNWFANKFKINYFAL